MSWSILLWSWEFTEVIFRQSPLREFSLSSWIHNILLKVKVDRVICPCLPGDFDPLRRWDQFLDVGCVPYTISQNRVRHAILYRDYMFGSSCDQAWQMTVSPGPSGESNTWALLDECTYLYPTFLLRIDMRDSWMEWKLQFKRHGDFTVQDPMPHGWQLHPPCVGQWWVSRTDTY